MRSQRNRPPANRYPQVRENWGKGTSEWRGIYQKEEKKTGKEGNAFSP